MSYHGKRDGDAALYVNAEEWKEHPKTIFEFLTERRMGRVVTLDSNGGWSSIVGTVYPTFPSELAIFETDMELAPDPRDRHPAMKWFD